MTRIQYDIDDNLWNRMTRYVSNQKMRHEVAKDALEEWVTRREGRDKKLQQERLESDMERLAPIVQRMLDDGLVRVGV